MNIVSGRRPTLQAPPTNATIILPILHQINVMLRSLSVFSSFGDPDRYIKTTSLNNHTQVHTNLLEDSFVVRSACKIKADISTTYFADCIIARLTDETTLNLSSYCECTIFHDAENKEYLSVYRPYQEQANKLVYRINIYSNIPEFVINDKHLPQSLIYELKKLDKPTLNEVTTEAVRRLYESASFDYFHKNAIHSKIKWRFGEEPPKN